MSTLEDYLHFLRTTGWRVAVHNDYHQNGLDMTFWLFTHKDGTYLKGEGQTDREALGLVVEQIKARIIASGGDSFLDMFLTPDNPPED